MTNLRRIPFLRSFQAVALTFVLSVGCGSSKDSDPTSASTPTATGGATNTGNTGGATNLGNTGGTTNIGSTGGATNLGNTGGTTNIGSTGGNTGSNTGGASTGGNTITFVPDPAKPIQIDRGPSAPLTLAEGTWSVFSFDAIADRLYCLSGVATGATAYVGTSMAVSPTEYMEKTDSKGFVSWTPSASGTYYVAIAATAGATSTSFEISEGGQLVTSGENTVTLAAPTSDSTYFFYFSVAPGHSYSVSLAGEAQSAVTLGLSPMSDRDATGQFANPFSTTTATLPIADQPVPYESSKTSLSRNYFVSVRVMEPVTLTITIALTF